MEQVQRRPVDRTLKPVRHRQFRPDINLDRSRRLKSTRIADTRLEDGVADKAGGWRENQPAVVIHLIAAAGHGPHSGGGVKRDDVTIPVTS